MKRSLILLFLGSVLCDEIVNHQIIDDTSVTTGIEHTCALHLLKDGDFAGRVLCWGSNGQGQSLAPKGSFIQVSAGRFHTCGVRMDGAVQCWGGNGAGTTPKGIFTQVSSGDFHTCGILKDETIACWGQNFDGQTVPPEGKFLQVSCGQGHSCALRHDGSVACWGANDFKQSDPPQYLRFLQISAAPGPFSCGVTTEKRIVCWGADERGQSSPPEDIIFEQVSTSRLSACGIQQDKTLSCWGMKDGIMAYPKETQFDEITLGWDHGCGIKTIDGKTVCWGQDAGRRLVVPAEVA